MAQDTLVQAKERFKDAKEAMRQQHDRMREDLRFSNPAEPEQWDSQARELRKGRPCLTFDRTNQFIAQVVNDSRNNKPSIQVLPADSDADPAVAQKLDGIIRHIEYVSRAGIAYDTAIEHAARVGLGWIRVIPEVMRPETNEQEIRIKRVHDPLSCLLDPNSTEPDGSDAMFGFAETILTERSFLAAYPKAKVQSFEADGWMQDDQIRIVEEFCVEETEKNSIRITLDGQSMTVGEDDYWLLRKQTGMELPAEAIKVKERKVCWRKLSGLEVLEETEFPSQFLPLIPVIGNELWIDGKRYLCGMTRRLMDSQRAYNYERSAFIEAVAMQPKAPIMVDDRAVEGFENAWSSLNTGNPAYLPYNGVDESGQPIQPPIRLAPPTFPVAFVQGGQIATSDMESSVGMFKANLGQPSNETSGRAIRERKMEGDIANFHYGDNMNRSIEQLGRIVVDMIPNIYDTARQARILGEDGSNSFVQIDPEQGQAVRREGNKVVSINPGVGSYDVRVKAGPSYISVRQEAAQNIIDISQGNPQLGAALAPLMLKMKDMPEADKAYKVALALLPPPVQQAYSDDSEDGIPPQVKAQMQGMQQQAQQHQMLIQQAQGMLQQADQQIEQLKAQLQAKDDAIAQRAEADKAKFMASAASIEIDAYDAETRRLVAAANAMNQQQANEIAAQTAQQLETPTQIG